MNHKIELVVVTKILLRTMIAIYATEPRFILRYSATHKKNLNVVYRLDSYDA